MSDWVIILKFLKIHKNDEQEPIWPISDFNRNYIKGTINYKEGGHLNEYLTSCNALFFFFFPF